MRIMLEKTGQPIIAFILIVMLSIVFWVYIPAILIILLWLYFFPAVISLLSGIVRGLLLKKWDTFFFALKIMSGVFLYEDNKKVSSGLITIISRLIWEQPQTLLGNFGMHIMNSVWLIKKIDFYKRAIICQGHFLSGGGIALGSFIMIDLNKSKVINIYPMDERAIPVKILIRHEYGHLLQSAASGPLYIFIYGISSIITQGWTEVDADLRSDNEFLFTEQIMPIFGSHRNQKQAINPKWWEFLIIPVLIFAGSQINGVHGITGGMLISTMLISLLNLKRPA